MLHFPIPTNHGHHAKEYYEIIESSNHILN